MKWRETQEWFIGSFETLQLVYVQERAEEEPALTN